MKGNKKQDLVAQAKKDKKFYLNIWKKRGHVCEYHEGFKYLGREPLLIFFDHILEKSKYPELRYVEENIALCCWDCHEKKTRALYNENMKNIIDKTKKLLLK